MGCHRHPCQFGHFHFSKNRFGAFVAIRRHGPDTVRLDSIYTVTSPANAVKQERVNDPRGRPRLREDFESSSG
jgi:hypothetical protein